MTPREAIDVRVSCRAYAKRDIDDETYVRLSNKVQKLTELSGISFELHGPFERDEQLELSRTMFAGQPPLYITCVAPEGEKYEELIGYFGEQFVLFATTLGLGTCWIHGTYKHDSARYTEIPGCTLHDVIPVGYPLLPVPLRQKSIRAAIRRKDHTPEQIFVGPGSYSQEETWVKEALEAVVKAPSAVNEQPVIFSRDSHNGQVIAELSRVKTGMEWCDLGIAKYHFELVAHAHSIEGSWEWGAPAYFVTTSEE